MKTISKLVFGLYFLCVWHSVEAVEATSQSSTKTCGDVKIVIEPLAEIQKGDPERGAYFQINRKAKIKYEIHLPSDVSDEAKDHHLMHESGHYVFYHLPVAQRKIWINRFSTKSFCFSIYGRTSYDECFAENFAFISRGFIPPEKKFETEFVKKIIEKIDSKKWVLPIEDCFKQKE